MPNDYFTLEEAHAVLPKINELVGEARELKRRADAKIVLWRIGEDADPVEKSLGQGAC
jgi:hypothetical protein